MFSKISKLTLSTALLSGTIIGAGIFSLPYVFSQLGVGFAVIYLIVFAFIYFFVEWKYAQILEIDDDGHHYFFFARKYLGNHWSKIALSVTMIGLLLSLVIYLILAPRFASMVFGGENTIVYLLIFWLFGTLPIFARTSWLGLAEAIGLVGIGAIIITIFFGGIAGSAEFVLDAPFKKADLLLFFLPFGPILYSLAGRTAVPKIYEITSGDMKMVKRALVAGTAIPALIYILFVIGVLGLVPQVEPDTISSLAFLPGWATVLVGATGLLTMWTSYFMIGDNVYDILRTDVWGSKLWSGAVVVLAPILTILFGLKSFILAVGFAGGVSLGLESIFIIIMWHKAKQCPIIPWSVLMATVFIFAIIYEIIKLFA